MCALGRQLSGKGQDERHQNQLEGDCSSGTGVKRHAQTQENVISSCKPGWDCFILRKTGTKTCSKIETHKAHKLGSNY